MKNDQKITGSEGAATVTAWALRRGFKARSKDVLEIAHNGGFIVIKLQTRNMRVGFEVPKELAKLANNQVLATPYYGRLTIDEHDMLHGAGLNSMFLNGFIVDGHDIPWFSEAYKNHVRTEACKAIGDGPTPRLYGY